LFIENPSPSCGASPAMWDHSVCLTGAEVSLHEVVCDGHHGVDVLVRSTQPSIPPGN